MGFSANWKWIFPTSDCFYLIAPHLPVSLSFHRKRRLQKKLRLLKSKRNLKQLGMEMKLRWKNEVLMLDPLNQLRGRLGTGVSNKHQAFWTVNNSWAGNHLIQAKSPATVCTGVFTHNAVENVNHGELEYHGISPQKWPELCYFGIVFTKLYLKNTYVTVFIAIIFWLAKIHHNYAYFWLNILILLPFWFLHVQLLKHFLHSESIRH